MTAEARRAPSFTVSTSVTAAIFFFFSARALRFSALLLAASAAARGKHDAPRATLREPACSEQPETARATGDQVRLTRGGIRCEGTSSARQARHEALVSGCTLLSPLRPMGC